MLVLCFVVSGSDGWNWNDRGYFLGDPGGQRVLCYVFDFFLASWHLVVFSAQSHVGKGCAVGVGIDSRAAQVSAANDGAQLNFKAHSVAWKCFSALNKCRRIRCKMKRG